MPVVKFPRNYATSLILLCVSTHIKATVLEVT